MAKIMVVDDEEGVVFLVKSILEKDGHEVIEAHSGEECLEKLEIEKPDLILLDIMMPGMDGWEVLRKIKNDAATKSIPVAMLTAKMLTVDTVQRKEVDGLVDYITKPFSIESLSGDVKEILEDISRIREVRDKLRNISPSVAQEYESLAMFEKIHRNLVRELTKLLEEKGREGSIDDAIEIKAAIDRESWLVEVAQNRRREMEKMVGK